MSDWSIVIPESTVNLCQYPSIEAGTAAELAAFVPVNVAARAQSFTQSRWGLYSLAITPHAANANSGVYYQVTGAATTTYTLSVWVYGVLGVAYQLRLEDSTPAVLATTNFVGTGGWARQEVTGTTLANVTIRCHLTSNLAATGVFYADGWQLEQKAYQTTYCDGERDGCQWSIIPHASTSSRSAQSRAGGRIRDLETIYGLNISGMTDFGVAPQTLSVNEFASLPGGEMASTKTHPRSFIITGIIVGTSDADRHNKRQAIISLFDSEAYPGEQPILFRYTGAAQERELAAYYQDGLEASIQAEEPCWWERVAIRFVAAEPFWYEVAETSWVLDHTDPLTFRYMAGRLRSTGQWDDLGLAANPVGGTGHVFTMVWGPDNNLYVGGDFTGLNGTGGAGSIDYVGCWDPETDTWSQVGAAGDLNDVVYKLAFDAAGLLHVGGAFTNVAGLGAGYEYIVTWDGANWGNLGTPGVVAGRIVRDMAWDSAGNLYIVGPFTDWVAAPGPDYIAMWDGANWNMVGDPDVGTAVINDVHAIVIASTDRIYVGGEFVNWNNNANCDFIAQYTTTAGWTALGTLVLNAIVYSLELRPEDDSLYAGGGFTTFGGNALNFIGLWNGYNWEPLGSGLVGTAVYCLKIAPDGSLLFGGNFTQGSDITFDDSFTKWNKSVYSHMDVHFGAGPVVECIETGSVDPIVPQNYDVFVGFFGSAAGALAGTATVANPGTELMFPSIKVSRTGAGTVTLKSIRNETTGKTIHADYDLLDGETIEIALEPTEKRMVSSFFKSRPDIVQASSDTGAFALQVGNNQVTCFVDVTAGAPVVVAWMVGRTKYAGQD